MSEPILIQVIAPKDRLGRALFKACRGLALMGGLALLGITLMSSASIASRALTGRALLGDFELVQLGCAVAVASFLPYGQMRRSHVLVDFFTSRASERVRRRLDAAGAILVALCAGVLAWRMAVGTIDVRAGGETSMLLGIPIWQVYLLMLPSFVLLALAGLHSAWAHLAGPAS